MPAPPELQALIERFSRNYKQYSLQDYKEAELRVEFIDPLFEMLGWDVANKKGYDEYHKEVVYEPSLETEGGTKAPDYAFRTGGITKFFVEAKKPAVDIGRDTLPSFQLRRYAWSAKLPLSILTNFKYTAVYDCRFKPNKRDSPSKARIMRPIHFEELGERWAELEETFSPQAIQTVKAGVFGTVGLLFAAAGFAYTGWNALKNAWNPFLTGMSLGLGLLSIYIGILNLERIF